MKYLLGIDVGTSGTKTVLFKTDATALSSYTQEYPLYQPENGWAEQEPEDWWRAVVSGIRSVIKESGVSPGDIAAVGLTGQMHGLVMLDDSCNVLRPAILWCDGRSGKECEKIEELAGRERLFEITANPALAGFTASKIMWVKAHEPENYKKCAHILLPKDYIRLRLTGDFATDASDAGGMQLLDIKNRSWSDEILKALDINKGLLPKVYESPEITGFVTEDAASLTGLCAKTPVAAGAGDNAAAAVGTGTVKDGKTFTTIGTSGVVYAHTSRMAVDPEGRVHTFCSAVPGQWHVMGVTQSAGLSLKWFRDNFCGQEKEKAEKSGTDPYALMDEKAAAIPVGANRLLYLPYLMGERTPHKNPNARGVFFGLSAIHTKSHMIRAVMEGVTFSLLDCLGILRDMNLEISAMMVCGGGAGSALWRQMLSDAFGIAVSKAGAQEGPCLGAAILAGVGAGIYKNVQTACEEIIKPHKGEMPDEKNSEEYRKYYEVYKSLYKSLKSDFEKISRLSNSH